MAEFRKREDISQEIGLLQTWSELGAPQMGDLDASLQALMKTVDPALLPGGELGAARRTARPDHEAPPRAEAAAPRGEAAPPKPPRPPAGLDAPLSPFEDLPPGDDDERASRGSALPLLAALLLGGAAVLYAASRFEPLAHLHKPVGASPGAKPVPEAAPSQLAAKPSPSAPHGTTGQASVHPAVTHGAASPPGRRVTPAHPHVVAAARQALPARVAEYTVKAGDSLSAIARDHLGSLDAWEAIFDANRDTVADPNLIEPGEVLKLPVAPSYVVRPGDTLKAIAQAKLGSADQWQALYALNRDRLSSPDVLPPGTTLELPPSAGAGAVGARRPALASAVATHHVVAQGDSLSLLARRYLGAESRWPEIYYLNSHRIANPHWIFPGQIVAIPAAHQASKLRYVVRSGDTLWAIAAGHLGRGARWARLYQLNRAEVRDPHWIFPGQALRLR